jgi:purine-nucleoside phosphorylase
MILAPEQQVRRAHEAAEVVRSRWGTSPRAGLILGTGLAQLGEAIEREAVIDYADIPHFRPSTVESHTGRLLLGWLEGLPVIAMQGRLHLYEGYSAHEVTFPVRVMGELGIDTLVISNAAGGLNPQFRRADLMLVTDQVNLQGVNPLEGANVDPWGPRFPDMSEAYDGALRALAREVADEGAIDLHEGVYVAVVGPNLETRAEYRYLRHIGGDAVGMSTVPEVIAARDYGLTPVAKTTSRKSFTGSAKRSANISA